MARRGWAAVVVAAVGLALLSLVSNLTSVSQLSGEADTLLAVRSTLSRLAGSGAVWAGLAVLSGWLVRRPGQAAVAGIGSSLVALVVHYGLAHAVGLVGSDVWASNARWFVAALVLGGPLGLVGALARRSDHWGLVARLVVPVAAVVEPFALGMFTSPAVTPWPSRVSSLVSGVLLVVGGVVGTAAVVRAARRGRSTARRRAGSGV